ncbi:MAG: uridine kinase [Chloroflexi bacterium]|nr:uridine kinase [Chloroflexota bacterium]
MPRAELIAQIADYIIQLKRPPPVKIAIDGIDASGKTTLADELATFLQQAGHPIIRASIDGFHNPREVRHQQGSLSPAGYFYDSFNYPALKKLLLDPLSENGDLHYQTALFDFKTDTGVPVPIEVAPDNAILLLDGVFLQRPELMAYWDCRIFVDVSFEVALARALERDIALFGDKATVLEHYQKRYIPAQQLYMRLYQPQVSAHIVVKNDDPTNATLIIEHS